MDSLLRDLNIVYQSHVPLGPLTWYGVGGPARVLARPSSVQQLSALASRCHQNGVPVYVLGSGANLLVRDEGVPGIVVKLDSPAFKSIRIDGTTVTAGAGYDLAKLVLETAKAGLGGLECLAGIPATVGGAIRMNAGGTYGDIGRSVQRVQVMDATGQVYYRDRDDLVFSYRRSNIVARFILEAEFDLAPEDPEALMKRVKEVFIVKKQSQPLAEHSAGCAFKNVPLPDDPDGPLLSAGKLIDQCGLKGFRIGSAEVSSVHANFIVAHEGATAADILAVIEHVEREVQQQRGIRLEREIVVWP